MVLSKVISVYRVLLSVHVVMFAVFYYFYNVRSSTSLLLCGRTMPSFALLSQCWFPILFWKLSCISFFTLESILEPNCFSVVWHIHLLEHSGTVAQLLFCWRGDQSMKLVVPTWSNLPAGLAPPLRATDAKFYEGSGHPDNLLDLLLGITDRYTWRWTVHIMYQVNSG